MDSSTVNSTEWQPKQGFYSLIRALNNWKMWEWGQYFGLHGP
jgi:hypothetical protein